MRLIILLLCLQSAAVSAAPRVVTSIVPLQELTASIMKGIAEPDLIIEDPISTHHFAFRPSHMRLLQQADLVIWIGSQFEAGFNRLPEILPGSTRPLELIPELGINNGDGHIWYSPKQLLRSIEIIATALMELDPKHQAQYRLSANELANAIARWRQDTQAKWQDKYPRFIADHAFTNHFEADMDLRAIATIHDQHDSHGGFKDLERIENQLDSSPAACLLTLEYPASPLAQSLAQKYQLEIVNVLLVKTDGQQMPPTVQRLEQLNMALLGCL
ncbi:MAG: zinc ABC transporter substrate-binding protein [Gammaproteobacteria bacterium]|nr:zinc ABC transporter substrate-binding protein [Gammaproteobacteria bacterium]MDH3857858.1 zinc ABC transporter substrate-binding protein [Gammaproteobacteria bacterium]